ncbi:MAG: baseplate J/gp47 family protein [Oscillospiraceae bacterium]
MKETEQIFSEMKGELERKTGICVNSGGDMALRLYAVAAEISALWAQVDWTKRQTFPQTAVGEELDKHAQTRGLERGAATRAVGLMRFETDAVRTEALTIAKGAVCLNSIGTEFLTTAAGAIAAGQTFCLVPAAARNTGEAGNAPAEGIKLMAMAPLGIVKCFNPEGFAGGTNGESDEALRARIMSSYASLPNGSNAAYYRSEALNTDGVAAACVSSRARGLGTVDVIIASDAGMPSDAMVANVKAKLAEQREICVDLAVLKPTAVSVPVTVAIDIEAGRDFTAVSAAVKAAIEKHFDGRQLGKSVLLAKLGSVVFGVEGVTNYAFSAPAADIEIAYNKLPVAGTITVSRR